MKQPIWAYNARTPWTCRGGAPSVVRRKGLCNADTGTCSAPQAAPSTFTLLLLLCLITSSTAHSARSVHSARDAFEILSNEGWQPYQCIPFITKWTGGTPPFTFSVYSALHPGNTSYTFDIDDNYYLWTSSFAAGTPVRLWVQDSIGLRVHNNVSERLAIQPSSNWSCLTILDGGPSTSRVSSSTSAHSDPPGHQPTVTTSNKRTTVTSVYVTSSAASNSLPSSAAVSYHPLDPLSSSEFTSTPATSSVSDWTNTPTTSSISDPTVPSPGPSSLNAIPEPASAEMPRRSQISAGIVSASVAALVLLTIVACGLVHWVRSTRMRRVDEHDEFHDQVEERKSSRTASPLHSSTIFSSGIPTDLEQPDRATRNIAYPVLAPSTLNPFLDNEQPHPLMAGQDVHVGRERGQGIVLHPETSKDLELVDGESKQSSIAGSGSFSRLHRPNNASTSTIHMPLIFRNPVDPRDSLTTRGVRTEVFGHLDQRS
ncbi:hypothetical protein C8Q76DRAFT_799601 [Earliella scabrosa]|nr:hypothetical protein C8Q76DRAFT_799601 [Earliella scabrosa]